MIPDLLWVIGCYAAAAALVQWAAKRRRHAPGACVLLVAGNHQLQIEGCIRQLWCWSRRTGTPLRIAVVLDRSEDDTERIVERLGRRDDTLVWWRAGEMRPIRDSVFPIRQNKGENHAVHSQMRDLHGRVDVDRGLALDGHVAESAAGGGDDGPGGADGRAGP